jgi:hypothetical protein
VEQGRRDQDDSALGRERLSEQALVLFGDAQLVERFEKRVAVDEV